MAGVGRFRLAFQRILQQTTCSNQIRHSSFQSSLHISDVPTPTTKYEVTNEAKDWAYVERALPYTKIPEPLQKDEYPSGWKPQDPNAVNLPYFVKRTRNHLIPVYMEIKRLGVHKQTTLKNVQGDIWLLEQELRKFLQPMSKRKMRMQVHEFAGSILIQGDYVNAVKFFLENKGL